jgi:hypothetical protein
MTISKDQIFFVFDVESIGLHGEGWAVGWVMIQNGKEIASAGYSCPPAEAAGDDEGRAWVEANAHGGPGYCRTPYEVRREFWDAWGYGKSRGAILVADCPWPVEARFLLACIEDKPERAADGPYPLIDVASVRLATGLDPLGTEERLPAELPVHNAQSDARQSARLLMEALEKAQYPLHEVAQGPPVVV